MWRSYWQPIKSLLLQRERLQLRWYGRVIQMSPEERTATKLLCQHRLVEGLEAVPELDGEIT